MVSLSRQNYRQSISVAITALLCVGVVIGLQLPQLKLLSKKSQTTSVADFKSQVESEKLHLQFLRKVPSLGFDNLLANWTFVNFLLYFGDDEARQKTGYSLSPEYFEIIVDRDPRFLRTYIFLFTSTTIYAGMPERSVALMNRGLSFLTPKVPHRSYYIWRYKAINELLFLGNPQAAKQSYVKAAQWASSYADDESKNVAKSFTQSAQFLAKNPNSKAAQISAWTSILTNAFDDQTRRNAINRIQSLGGKVNITSSGQVNIVFPKE